MRQTVIDLSDPPFRWIDVVAPDPAELKALAQEFSLHPMAVDDCLDPYHLPKYEQFGDTTFVILRVFDRQCTERAANVQELTRKIAIFFRAGTIITIHRSDLSMVAKVREGVKGATGARCSATAVLGSLFNGALDSFEEPLDLAEDAADDMEAAILDAKRSSPDLEHVHLLKRRVNTMKRLFWQTNSVLQKLAIPGEGNGAVFHDVKENGESYYFYADQLLDEINNVLSIHVALSSHRTNEVMRVLTVFSAFFLPLTFIVGVYGMNFKVMPELETKWGYPMVWVVMVLVCLAIGWWFRRRGWWGRGAE